MTKSKKHRKSAITVLIVFLSIALSGCFGLKSIPANDIGGISSQRKIIQIHAGDSIWNISNIRITGNELIGQIYNESIKPYSGKLSHVYVAPANAVKSDKIFLSVPMKNIGKADYFAVSWPQVIGIFLTAMLFFAIV